MPKQPINSTGPTREIQAADARYRVWMDRCLSWANIYRSVGTDAQRIISALDKGDVRLAKAIAAKLAKEVEQQFSA